MDENAQISPCETYYPLEKNNNLTEFILILKEQHNFFLMSPRKKKICLVNFFLTKVLP